MSAEKPGEAQTAGGSEVLKEGIYLEEKKSSIGTGGTAKLAEYRSFWATVSIGESSAVMLLLDDDFKPTPIREKFSLETLKGPGWHYIAEGEKRYQRLKPYLERLAAPPAAPAQAPAAQAAAPGAWWEAKGSQSTVPKKKKSTAISTKKNWWD